MQKVPGGWRSSLLCAGNNNITSIKTLTAKLVPIETADNAEQNRTEGLTDLIRRTITSRNGIQRTEREMTKEVNRGDKITTETEAATIIERTINKTDLHVIGITALIHLRNKVKDKNDLLW